MKYITTQLVTTCLLLTGLIPLGHAEVQPLDRVVAIVDEGVVMESELNAKMRGITNKLRASNTELPPMDILRTQVLDHLVNEQIQLLLY